MRRTKKDNVQFTPSNGSTVIDNLESRILFAGELLSAGAVSIAFDSGGALHVAYYDSEGAVVRFAHGSCGPGVTKCKRHGAINSVPFATLSMTRDVARSVGDVATLLVDDRRRVLHALWAQPVDEAGTPALRIFHAQAQLKK